MQRETVIDNFSGDFYFLSNFAYSDFVYKGIKFKTVEHFFQASKTLDKGVQQQIISCRTPTDARKLGKVIKLRDDWENVKINIMKFGLYLKFTQNQKLLKKLLDTGDVILIEGNHWHDNQFGNCTCDDCKYINGKNLLGKLLMSLRKELREKIV